MMRAPAADLFTPKPEPEVLTRYATDGKCHNAEPGTFNHECGKPATWLGTSRTREGKPFTSGYCSRCKADGYESRGVTVWKRAPLLEQHDEHVIAFRIEEGRWMRREYRHAGVREP